MTTFLGFSLLLLWGPLCHAQFPKNPNVAPVESWPDLHWGMTSQEVLEVLKGKADLIPNRQIRFPVDGSPDLVRIDKLIVNGTSYSVRFAFDSAMFTYPSNRRTNSRRPGYVSDDNTSQTWGCSPPCQYCSSTRIGRNTRTAHGEEEYGSAPGSLLSRLELAIHLCSSRSQYPDERNKENPDDPGHLFRCLDTVKPAENGN